MRDTEEPLGELALLDDGTGAPAAAIDDLLVGEHGIVDRIPVHLAGLSIDEALVEHLQEQGLLRAVIVRIAGCKLPAPVERQAELLQLRPHGGDVFIGPFARMDAALERSVLGRHSERIPTHGVEDIVSIGAAMAGNDVTHGIVAHMAHVHPAGRIGEHFEDVCLGRVTRLGG